MAKDSIHVINVPDRIVEIRSIALAEIVEKSGKLDHWHYFGELNRLIRRPLSADWLEAMVMICAIGRMRPAQATGFLNKLRERCTAAQEPERFRQFTQRLNAYLSPLKLTNHGYKQMDFGNVDHDEVWSHLGEMLARLEQHGYEVFLNSGTLLGVVRDGRLIEHDDDVDLAVILPAKDAVSAATAWKDLARDLAGIGVLDPEGKDVPGILKLKPFGDVEVDLFPAWVEEEQVFVYPHTRGELHRDEVLPTAPCPITGHKRPAQPEKMLALNYGAGWKTPDPLFKFPWSEARKSFSTFLEEVRS